jgi:hypothetical protein
MLKGEDDQEGRHFSILIVRTSGIFDDMIDCELRGPQVRAVEKLNSQAIYIGDFYIM